MLSLNYNGKVQSLKQWSVDTRTPVSTISNRLHRGWSVNQALGAVKRDYKRKEKSA